MKKRFSTAELYKIRNKIPIEFVIRNVIKLRWDLQKGTLRFCCPVCGGFHTATNRHTNLARCFSCKRNFNTIDIVMLVSGNSFVQSVAALKKYCRGAMQRKSRESAAGWKSSSAERVNQEAGRSLLPQSIKEIMRELCR